VSEQNKRDWFTAYSNRLTKTVFRDAVIRRELATFQDDFNNKVYAGGFHNINAPFNIYELNYDYSENLIKLPDSTIGYHIEEDALILTKKFKDSELTYEVVILEQIDKYSLRDQTSNVSIFKEEEFPYEELSKPLQKAIIHLVLITKRAAKQAYQNKRTEQIPGIDWDNV
jgi:hypothetical protein